jgi:alpha-lytic protease prodomain-containing protein
VVVPVVLAALLAPVCHGQLAPPTKAERRQAALENYAEQRASFGFRSDLPYVEELIRRGVWEYDVGYIPVTPAENRYLRLRDRLGLGGRAYRYLRKRRDLSGGISVEDDWPRGPYLLVRLTRDRAAHEANLKRLARFPRNLRTVEVRYSERQLRRVADRIDPDLDELKAEGFDVASWGLDISTNSVVVDLITTRTDHAEYFAARYGPVTTEVIATEPTFAQCVDAGRYEIADGGSTLVLHWGSSGDAEPGGVELREYPDRVEVGVVERLPSGGWTDDLVGYTSRVALSAPLGERAVVDAADGERMRQSGPSPGEPACPREREHSSVDEWVSIRREMGMRHDRAFVRRVLRGGSPYTKAEEPYVAAWERLDLDPRLARYFARHWREFGGREIRGYPGRPYVLASFTRRLAFHRRNLERIVPARVVRSRYTERELYRLRGRVKSGFLDGWGDAGILVTRAFVEGGRVQVHVVTTRDDYVAVVRERYGPAVRVVRVGTRHECA